MRKDRDDPPGWTVEFVDEARDPAVADGPGGASGPARVRGLAVAGLAGLLLVFAVGHVHGETTAEPRPRPPAPEPSLVRPSATVPTVPVGGPGAGGVPTPAISAAFAAAIPGSIVVSERTRLADRGRTLHSRTIRAVFGNVLLDIVVARLTGPPPSHAIRLRQGIYGVTIRSTGHYPPTRRQLERLAADRRLTGIV